MKAKHRLLRRCVIGIEILAAVATLPLLYIGATSLVWGIASLPIFFLIVLPLIFLIVCLYFLRASLRTKAVIPEIVSDYKKINAPLFIIHIIFSVLFIIFIGFAIYDMMNEKPPAFFPFDDQQASYTILKEQDRYWIHYLSTSDRTKHTVCTYENGKTDCHEEIDKDIQIYIGYSNTDLQPYIGKKVIIDGDFVYAHEQCIEGKCVDIANSAVLNISSIRPAEINEKQ